MNIANIVFRFINSSKGFVNSIISYISSFAVFLIEILPGSPFIAVLESMKESDLLMSIDWVIPFTSFIAIGIAWTTAIGLFYIISVALRWVKAIQ